MSFEANRIIDFKWAFSAKKQTDLATVLLDADLTLVQPIKGVQVFNPSRTSRNDLNLSGKGFEFPTPPNYHEVTRTASVQRQMYLNSLNAAWAAAFGMGKVTTSQPSAGPDPTVYQHIIVPSDPTATGKSVPVTTIYEEVVAGGPAGWKNKLRGIAVEEFKISGVVGDILMLDLNLVGAGEFVQDPVTVGATTTVDFLDMQHLLFKIGTQGAAVDLSERLLSFEVNWKQNIDLKNAYFPGSGLYGGRFWMGNREPSLKFKMWLDSASSDIRDLWLANTLQEVSFKSTGDIISHAYAHSMEILFPSVRLSATPVGEADGKMIYDVSVDPAEIYHDALATIHDPMQITVINTQPTFFT